MGTEGIFKNAIFKINKAKSYFSEKANNKTNKPLARIFKKQERQKVQINNINNEKRKKKEHECRQIRKIIKY